MNLQFWGKAADFLWSGPLAAVLLGLGAVTTIRCGVPQRHLPAAIRESLRPGEGSAARPFTALMLHLAATLGVGNITGVAAAIAVGGRGAVVWCWLSGILGIATAYAETRGAMEICPGEVSPMHALAAHGRLRLAAFYALALAVAGLFMGAMLPANAIDGVFALPRPMGGTVLAVLAALVIFGGIGAISRTCEKLVPAVMILFTAGCIGILWVDRSLLPQTLTAMVTEAFTFRAAAGGVIGSAAVRAMRSGIARGLFSNEAGLGTAALTVGAVGEGSPHSRGMVAAAAVFWDTVVFCGLTGLSFCTAATADPSLFAMTDGVRFSLAAFDVLPMGEAVLQVCLAVLGFCCIIGWSFVGTRGFTYLCPGHGKLYCALWCGCILLGTLLHGEVIWIFSDLANICVILPSLCAIRLYLRRRA